MKTIDSAAAMAAVQKAKGLSSKERKALANGRLRELIAYAKENSPFLHGCIKA